ncbi:DsbC family protein [Thiomonas sp.]|jgi:thiol:disulfide interchange protein DsbC|uniref:DsbC family protein n=1 Tax=Thiomonas sp. TaxID=2047785 RepID=UPI00261C41D8|nr:DsbC family protein [Thiomonas sp.]
MNFRRFLISAVGALALLAGAAHAADNTEGVRRALSKVLPNFPASAHIVKTPYAGLYEVDFGDHVFYTDATGTFLFAGNILDTRSGVNVTQARVQQLQKVEWNKLPLKDSFKVVYGNGARQVAVFEDPYCPFCREFDKNLAKAGNMTVHVFLYPVISKDSPAKSRQIWCAPDRGQAWLAWMGDHKEPPVAPASCNSDALQANLALGQKLNIQSTPTTFLHDGTRITGAIEYADLVKALDSVK